jgi:alkylation response protein AidB-like acyl-CoA dehydrogenase
MSESTENETTTASVGSVQFPSDVEAKRAYLLDAVGRIAETLRVSGPESEDAATLAPAAVAALRDHGLFRLKMPAELGGAEADALTEMLVLEEIAYHDLTSGWCTMVGATSVASIGAFLPDSGISKTFKDGHIPTASVSFFPAGLAKPQDDGYSVTGRWRFNSGIDHAEWVVGGAVIEGTEGPGGRPKTMFCVFPHNDVEFHENWNDVVGLKGTGSYDFSVQDHFIPNDLTFVWDMAEPQALRGGEAFLMPPILYVAKEHASVAIGAGRRALDELIKLATTTKGTFRPSSLAERQVVQRFIGESDLKLRSARALMHRSYIEIERKISTGWRPDAAAITEGRSIALFCTDIAKEIAAKVYHFGGNTALHGPNAIEQIFRDIHTAGLHQVVSDTSYENLGHALLGLPVNPMA